MSGRVPTELSMCKQEIMRHYSELYGSRDRFQSISPHSNIYGASTRITVTGGAQESSHLSPLPVAYPGGGVLEHPPKVQSLTYNELMLI